MDKKISSALALLITAFTLGAFQNCAPGGSGKGGVNSLERQAGGSGDPYEGGNGATIVCENSNRDWDIRAVQVAIEDQRTDLRVIIGDATHSVYQGPNLPPDQMVAGAWPLPGVGTLAGVGRSTSPYGLRLVVQPTGQSPVEIFIPCD